MTEKKLFKTVPYYMIVSRCSGMALDVMEQSARVFYPLNTPMQHWSFEDRGNGCLSIINRGTHQVLDVDMAGIDNGSAVHLWNDVNADNQLWMLEPCGTDLFRIKAKHSGRYLDLADQSLYSDARLQIWDATTSDTQIWILREVVDEPVRPVEVSSVVTEAQLPQPVRRGRKKLSDADREAAASFGAALSVLAEEESPAKPKPARRGRKPSATGPKSKTEKAASGRKKAKSGEPVSVLPDPAPDLPVESADPTKTE